MQKREGGGQGTEGQWKGRRVEERWGSEGGRGET